MAEQCFAASFSYPFSWKGNSVIVWMSDVFLPSHPQWMETIYLQEGIKFHNDGDNNFPSHV